VVYADALRGFGLLVIVDHGGGYLSLYGYNSAVHRAAGDTVRPGDVLADVGGGLTVPDGLYFEIRANGRPVDPARWCRG
jgi:murein hydrolase activator